MTNQNNRDTGISRKKAFTTQDRVSECNRDDLSTTILLGYVNSPAFIDLPILET